MLYISTRGQVQALSFEDAVMTGLADDGGLLLPATIPQVSHRLSQWRSCTFQELCLEIMTLFIEDEIPKQDLNRLIQQSYTSFRHSEVTPIRSVGTRYILELFHGPTFAFKDVALQFLGNLFEYFLEKRHHPLTVLGATSGDTGSAAIYGLRGKHHINVFMLHPKGRVSPMQEKQMTTVLDPNIHNLAVEGTFDDAQHIVKALFNDLSFKQQYHLGAINSINWARLLAQIVYYFYAYFRVTDNESSLVHFSVPTGNFGDVFAGYLAKQMGLPIDRLIVATNENDILYRFFTQGKYHQETVQPSLSPSMDIQISSNFERYLYFLSNQSSEQLSSWMASFHESGQLTIEGLLLEKAQKEMSTARVDSKETLEIIRRIYEENDYLLDPHTAVGVMAAEKCQLTGSVVCLATAHPAKFGNAVTQAIGKEPDLPEALAALQHQPTRCETVAAEIATIKKKMMQSAAI
jgi:threonine synthase